ncbi:DUF4381 domain-containing protein [Pseudomonas sp. KNUC1026]|uniref:DUF4381 domain-containing protein n=1 Tax=Pseudomonas sp. KNUC1026 TaxID=2893890 RepID=UPI001F343FF7|nr:DUF4381 domain-containing protein [Pseudomonas sp. KNUC1026]UFH50676.1 DUF4381 domain-containing protein [Pseudomonas sp. KNUC1026]
MTSLLQLEPLIPPPQVSAWPLAPGWWALPVLLLALAGLAWRYRHWRPRRAPVVEEPIEEPASEQDPLRTEALIELAMLTRPYGSAPAGAWLQQLNGLLKRLCRIHYPGSNSHTLNGRQWLAFLDNRCPAAGLTRWMVLVEGVYKPECRLDDKAIDGLNQAVAVWIRKHV